MLGILQYFYYSFLKLYFHDYYLNNYFFQNNIKLYDNDDINPYLLDSNNNEQKNNKNKNCSKNDID